MFPEHGEAKPLSQLSDEEVMALARKLPGQQTGGGANELYDLIESRLGCENALKLYGTAMKKDEPVHS